MVINPLGDFRVIKILTLVLLTSCLAGCRIQNHAFLTRGALVHQQISGRVIWPTDGPTTKRAERFLEIAHDLSKSDDSRSVDYFFKAASLSWLLLTEQAKFATTYHPSWGVYQEGLQGLVVDANRFQRFDGCGNLKVYTPDGPTSVPIISSTMDWPIEQLQRFQLPHPPERTELKRYYKKPGLGLPLLVFRNKPQSSSIDPVERFFPEQLPLASTILLRATDSEQLDDRPNPSTEEASQFVLELVDPLRVSSIQIQSRPVAIAKDLSAPLDHQIRNRPTDPLLGFILPSIGGGNDGLRWVGPYQPGKIPVVFIHGLMSEPTTWFDMLNELRTIPWFNDHYQVWGFSYDTGSPFVTSAMRLREQCQEAISLADPHEEDPALSRMILIGHSMGGLLAKLQITDSQDRLWNSISNTPLQRIRASPDTKKELEKRLFFTPRPNVKRVIYIATPHQGSSIASRATGRLFSAFVQPDQSVQSLHDRLVRDNPNAFTGIFRKRIPTSIDLLEPSDNTLQAIYDLPVTHDVRQHLVIGTGDGPWTLGLNDGVVPVTSARHPCANTEVRVEASHTKILKHEATISEVVRLLHLHLMEHASHIEP